MSGTSAKLDYTHYVCFPDDGQRHEIVNGEHYVNPAPSTYHQTISRRIQFELYTQIELQHLGQVFDAPVDLQLGEHDIVQPDIVVVLSEHEKIITPSKIKGIPDLIIEILSPSTAEKDRVLKRRVYEASRVPEYWIVDPLEHHVTQLVRDSRGNYQSTLQDKRIAASVLPHVSLELARVW